MIAGLQYLPNYISAQEETSLVDMVDKQLWLSPLQRRVQHYGYIYDYKKRTVTEDMFIGGLPEWLQSLANQLKQDGCIAEVPDQVIINEYEAGQGIAPHVDCEPCFGDTILSLSLGSACVMDFYALKSEEVLHQLLAPCSLLIMEKEARYNWKHGIMPRKSDSFEGKTIQRGRRISLTFRKVVLHSK
jgi:alkylated DNA repair dioxygenase AlkB